MLLNTRNCDLRWLEEGLTCDDELVSFVCASYKVDTCLSWGQPLSRWQNDWQRISSPNQTAVSMEVLYILAVAFCLYCYWRRVVVVVIGLESHWETYYFLDKLLRAGTDVNHTWPLSIEPLQHRTWHGRVSLIRQYIHLHLLVRAARRTRLVLYLRFVGQGKAVKCSTPRTQGLHP